MKILAIISFLLPILAVVSVTSSLSAQDLKDLSNYIEENALLATNENRDHSTDDVDLSDVQGVFNVLAQVEIESNKLLVKETDASAQIFSAILPLLGNVLWDVGKNILKNNLCPKNRSYGSDSTKVLHSWNDADSNKVLNQLKVLFGLLKEVEAKIAMMQDDITDSKQDAKAKAQWKIAKQSITQTIGTTVKKFLC